MGKIYELSGFNKRDLSEGEARVSLMAHYLFVPDFKFSTEDGYDRFHFKCYCGNEFSLFRESWLEMCKEENRLDYAPSCGCYHKTPTNTKVIFEERS